LTQLTVYQKESIPTDRKFHEANEKAQKLLLSLNETAILDQLREANKPKSSSALIQNCFLPVATSLGFRNEAKGLFEKYSNKLLRPDYYLDLGNGCGILLEVERGKTTINNMDLLDFWKCHICEHANYLFLLVPQELRQNDLMAPRKEYITVCNRLKSFFISGSYTNVDAVFIFGY
jgi:hypothetical protein